MEQILTTAAILERGYLAYQGNTLSVFDEQVTRLDQSFRLWLERVEAFRKKLNADENITPMQCDNVHAGLTQIADRLIDLQTKLHRHKE